MVRRPTGPLLSVEHLQVLLRAPAGARPLVSDVSFAIAPGEVVALVGETGSGKSLTARALLGLLPKGICVGGGTARFEGTDLLTRTERELEAIRGRHIGLVLQDALGALNPVLTVGRQITEVLERHEGLRGRAAARRAAQLLGQVGLEEPEALLRTYPHQLSGGMRQRVLIAQALAGRPRLLIADEPTTALDMRLRAQVLSLLSDLRRKEGMAMLLITHDLSAVAGVADQMVVMSAGQTVEAGPVEALLSHPAHPYTRRLVAAVPRLDGGPVRLARAPSCREEAAEPLLSVQGLTKHFTLGGPLDRRTVRAVDGVSFELNAGETLALVGESGSGKSTLGRAILGLLRPTGGAVRFLGREMGAIFQDPAGSLNPRMSVAESVAEPLEAAGKSRTYIRERVPELLEMVKLGPEFGSRLPHQLSGGQRQRVGIARALALDPRLIVADEPLSALDVSVQAQVIDLLAGLRERLGLSYLFITHDLAVCRYLADRVAVMQHGKLVEIGPTDQVLLAPADRYTRSLVAAVPRWGRAFSAPPGAM